jgi:hypothetical protein
MMTAQYVCSFANPATGEQRSVVVELDADDEVMIEYHRNYDGDDQADFVALAAALRHAYQKVPKGFLHDREPERRWLQ